MSSIEFKALTASEIAILRAIARRAEPLFRAAGIDDRTQTNMDTIMDVHAVHSRIPLRLADLLDADDFNFAHDVAGIYRHIDRGTGQLTGAFLPRCAVHLLPEED